MSEYGSVVRGAFTGEYPVVGDIAEADCIGGHAFGIYRGPEAVNRQLGDIALEFAEELNVPLMLEKDIADLLEEDAPDYQGPYDFVVNEGGSTTAGGGPGAWGALEQFAEHMSKHNLSRPLLIGHAHHIGRVAIQARKQGLDPIIPRGLPTQFDHESTQRWTKSRGWWVPYECAGYFELKRRKQI